MTEAQQQYPTGVNPELIKQGEIDGGNIDGDLKDAETEEHIGFVRKVLGIVTVQMSFTFLLCVLSSNSKALGTFFKNPLVLILSFILLITCTCYISFGKDARKKVPLNYILLAGATLGESFFLAAVAADLTSFSLYMAIMATCLAVGGLFVAALYTASTVNRDVLIRNMVTAMITTLFIDLFMVFVTLILYNPKDKEIVIGISLIMIVVVSAYIMFAMLFIIVPGIHDKDDYILGALRLYLEIARLFFWMMRLLGERRRD